MTRKKMVTLNPGESKTVSFGITPTVAKTYQVLVDGLAGSFVAVAPPFDPWSYDFNGDGIIDKEEVIKAVQDYFAGIITKEQAEEVGALYEATKPPPPLDVVPEPEEEPEPLAGRIRGMLIWHEPMAGWESASSGREIPLNEEVHLTVMWVNESEVNIVGHVDLTVTYPDGSRGTLTAVENQDRSAAPVNGWSVRFQPFLSTQEGTYTLEATLSSGGQVLDSLTFTLNAVVPEPEPEPATGSLSGTISEAGTNVVIEDARVEIRATFTIINQFGIIETPGYTGHTDDAGRYRFDILPVGDYIIKISASGYEPVEDGITISEGSNTLDVPLDPIVIPDKYLLAGGYTKRTNDNGSFRSIVIGYYNKNGYSGIPIMFEAWVNGVQYSFVQSTQEGSQNSYDMKYPGPLAPTRTLPRKWYDYTGYYLQLTNNSAILGAEIRIYLGVTEGTVFYWRLVKTLR